MRENERDSQSMRGAEGMNQIGLCIIFTYGNDQQDIGGGEWSLMM